MYCDDPVPAFSPDFCAKEQARIVAVAFIRSDNTTLSTYTAAAEWTDGVADGTIIIIKNVRGSKPKSSAIKQPGFGLQKEFSTGRDFSLTFAQPDVVGNEDFWNAMNYNNSYSVAYYTAGGKVWITGDAVVNVDSDHEVVEDLTGIITQGTLLTWSTQDIPVAYTAPAGVFTT